MHEINASAFGNRIDVLAVDRAEIIAVEIKSERDKIDRLPKQVAAMRGCAHHVIAALHEKFYIETKTNRGSAEYERDGDFYYLALPREARGVTAWRWPEPAVSGMWREPAPTIQGVLPSTALGMLWRDELLEMCGTYGVCVPKRPTMSQMLPALHWQLSGADLTKGICAALRARKCIEADPPIEEDAALVAAEKRKEALSK